MTGLFIQRHAELASGFAEVAVLYLRAAPDKRRSFVIDHKVENWVFTAIVYYGTKSALPKFMVKWMAGFRFVMAFFKGYSYIQTNWNKPNLVHVNVLTRLGLLALYLRCFKGIKYVITEHWSRYLPITGTYKGFLRKVATRLVVKHASAVSTVSENLASAMQSHGLHNLNYLILPNVVDCEEYIPAPKKSKGKVIRFMHISCFEDRSKNISGLLRTITRLSLQRNDFECIMVGEGVDFERLKSLATELGLKAPILQFTGLLEGEKLVEAYQSSDFMVMFSNYENMPVVISESFACGLPVVATSVGGIPEYVNDTNGRLIAVGDEAALLGAIGFMLDNYSSFDPAKIRETAVAVFSKQAVTGKLKELYSFVIN